MMFILMCFLSFETSILDYLLALVRFLHLV